MSQTVIKAFFSFISRYETFDKDLRFKEKVLILLKLYLYLFLFFFFINLIINYLTEFVSFQEKSNSLSLNNLPKFNNTRLILVILLFLTPLHEELTFRLCLGKFKKQFFLTSLALILGYVVYQTLNSLLVFPAYVNPRIEPYLYFFLFGVFFYLILNYYIPKYKLEWIRKTWDNYPLLIFYVITILFTVLHFNSPFSGAMGSTVLRVVYLIPIFAFSAILGFIRVNIGFIYALIFHIIFNLPNILIRINL